jgi:hypothetical protein
MARLWLVLRRRVGSATWVRKAGLGKGSHTEQVKNPGQGRPVREGKTMESEIMAAIDKVADKVIELQDKVAAYIRSGSSVPESLIDELTGRLVDLDDLQQELEQCEC